MKDNIVPKISIIVAIYQVEKYLRRCLDSIREQTFSDWECILIDDGSRDNSGKICDEYAEIDNRFRVIHKDNGGVSSARQLGIETAIGKYSIHIDPDDYVAKSFLNDLYEVASKEDTDIVCCDFYSCHNDIIEYIEQKPCKEDADHLLQDILCQKLLGVLWNKLIKHELYNKFHIRFVEGINCREDVLVLSLLLQHNLKITYVHQAYYYYVRNDVSITRKKNKALYDSLTKYIVQLKTNLGDKHGNLVSRIAYLIKIEAFLEGFMTERDYATFFPTSIMCVMKYSNSIPRLICGLLLAMRLNRIALMLRQIKQKIGKK